MTALMRKNAKTRPRIAQTIERGTPDSRKVRARKVITAPVKVGDFS
jgi:hypothetical protein